MGVKVENEPKFPNVVVKITGKDSNAFSIMGDVAKKLRKGEATADQIKQFYEEATSGDYDHLLQVVMKWVYVE